MGKRIIPICVLASIVTAFANAAPAGPAAGLASRLVKMLQIDIIVDPDGGGDRVVIQDRAGVRRNEPSLTIRDDMLCTDLYDIRRGSRLRRGGFRALEQVVKDENGLKTCIEVTDAAFNTVRGALSWTIAKWDAANGRCSSTPQQLKVCLHDEDERPCRGRGFTIVGDCVGTGIPEELSYEVVSWKLVDWENNVTSGVGTDEMPKFRFDTP